MAFNVVAGGSTTCAENAENDMMTGNDAFNDYVLIPFEEVRNQGDWVSLPSEESRALDPNGYR